VGHVDARFQDSKPRPKSRVKWHENDGRAPDTRERLAAVHKVEAELVSETAALTEEDRWIARNSAPGLPPPPAKSTQPSALLRQSYAWNSNSCFTYGGIFPSLHRDGRRIPGRISQADSN
jgi:hypothetical protein